MSDARPHAALRFASIDDITGYSEGADRLVRALRDSDVRVEYLTLVDDDGRTPSLDRHSRDRLPDESVPPGAPTAARFWAEKFGGVRAAIGSGLLVGLTVWETEPYPAARVALLNEHLDRVIVPTEWNKTTFEASGVTAPVCVVPHVACDPVDGDGGRALELPDDTIVFYTIGEWNNRKQPGLALRAFLDAFTIDDPVAFVLKTAPAPSESRATAPAPPSPWNSTPMREVAKIISGYPRPPAVRFEIGVWPADRIAGLHARGDCFVSLTHSEGWHIGAFDAAAYGNPVVMTGWGGHRAYLRDEETFLVEYELVRRPRPHHPEQHDHWAKPSVDYAVEQLRAVAADLAGARRRAEPQQARVRRDYAPAQVAHEFALAVPEIHEVAATP